MSNEFWAGFSELCIAQQKNMYPAVIKVEEPRASMYLSGSDGFNIGSLIDEMYQHKDEFNDVQKAMFEIFYIEKEFQKGSGGPGMRLYCIQSSGESLHTAVKISHRDRDYVELTDCVAPYITGIEVLGQNLKIINILARRIPDTVM